MKLIKRIPFQMFLLTLFAGIVCISGMLIMQFNLNKILDNYRQNIERNLTDRLAMSDICRLMSRHHIIVSWHTLTDSPESMLSYEEEAALLENDIMSRLNEINESISATEKEQLFHTVYSNTISYFSNTKNVFQLSREGSDATAKYYMTSFLTDFIDKITGDVEILDNYIAEEMKETVKNMEYRIAVAETSEKICIACICLVMAVCIAMCVSITFRLEKYKNQLEEENARKTQALIEHSHRMLTLQENTIIGMATLIENRDQDTGEHVKRTSKYVKLLTHAAQKAGYCSDILTDEYAELLIKAAPMHDIGKIAISDLILQKPDRLTHEEFEIMKSHTTAGGRIIVEAMGDIEEKEYIDIASQVAEGHHEKWDGSGYPKGLKGDEIPIGARIMAVADVFDALISRRCYKNSMSIDEAFDIISKSAGSHFDPELAKLFCTMKDDVKKIVAQFQVKNQEDKG